MQKIIFLTCFVLEITRGGDNFYPPHPPTTFIKKSNQNRVKSASLLTCVPISLNEDESIYFGKILTHCFIQCNTFPTSFPKAILEYILFDKVRDETLRESFCKYVSGHEKALILRCLTP